MATCPTCNDTIADGAVVCKHCGARFGTPSRPTGVTILAVLCLLGGVVGLLSTFALNRSNSVFLGFRVPVPFMMAVNLIGVVISFYCGIGFLKLKSAARKLYLYWAVFGLAQAVITPVRLLSSTRVPDTVVAGMAIGFVLGLGFYGWIIYYIVRKKEYFVN